MKTPLQNSSSHTKMSNSNWVLLTWAMPFPSLFSAAWKISLVKWSSPRTVFMRSWVWIQAPTSDSQVHFCNSEFSEDHNLSYGVRALSNAVSRSTAVLLRFGTYGETQSTMNEILIPLSVFTLLSAAPSQPFCAKPWYFLLSLAAPSKPSPYYSFLHVSIYFSLWVSEKEVSSYMNYYSFYYHVL